MGINRVVISGNLTRDPEVRMTAGGTEVLSFGMAVDDRRRNPATGEWEDAPNFVDCVVFGPRAAALARRLSKGAKVAVEGRLRWSGWERDGERRSKLEVVADEVDFMSPRAADGAHREAGVPVQPAGELATGRPEPHRPPDGHESMGWRAREAPAPVGSRALAALALAAASSAFLPARAAGEEVAVALDHGSLLSEAADKAITYGPTLVLIIVLLDLFAICLIRLWDHGGVGLRFELGDRAAGDEARKGEEHGRQG